MRQSTNYVLGIDIGGTDVKAIALTTEGTKLDTFLNPTELSPGNFLENTKNLIGNIRLHFDAAPLAIGIASPGLAAKDGRSIAWMQGRMERIQGVDWTECLDSPTLVPVLNDAHAALIGEVWQGAAKDCKDVVMLTLGTGVGGAAMTDGNLLRGHLGRAGHLGHISLDSGGKLDIVNTPGSLEDAIGNCTIAERSEGRFADTKQLVKAFLQGDEFAIKLWNRTIRDLSAGIASFINILDPEVVIIGGGMIAAGDALFSLLETEMNRFEWRPTGSKVRIVPAQLGSFAGAYGAAFQSINLMNHDSLRTTY